MRVNWCVAYNRLFKIINEPGNTYYSGPDFIRMVQQVDESIIDYNNFMQLRKQRNLSTSRKDFYWDIIQTLEESQKHSLFRLFIDALESDNKAGAAGLRETVFSGVAAVPNVVIPQNLWNFEKLNNYLKEIDKAVEGKQFNRAVTLAYTCLEGLYKAYIRKNIPEQSNVTDLISLAKLVKNDILAQLGKNGNFPKQIINSIPTITNAVANSRNSFSESHFDSDANKWLAVLVRDLTNSIGRMLLNFM